MRDRLHRVHHSASRTRQCAPRWPSQGETCREHPITAQLREDSVQRRDFQKERDTVNLSVAGGSPHGHVFTKERKERCLAYFASPPSHSAPSPPRLLPRPCCMTTTSSCSVTCTAPRRSRG